MKKIGAPLLGLAKYIYYCPLDILKFSMNVRPKGHKQLKWINMTIQFLFLCSQSLIIKVNFNISKEAFFSSQWCGNTFDRK